MAHNVSDTNSSTKQHQNVYVPRVNLSRTAPRPLQHTPYTQSLLETLQDQTTAFGPRLPLLLGPSGHEILCASFKSEVFISPSSLGLPKLSPARPSKPNALGLVFPVQNPGPRSPTQGSELHSCARTSAIIL